MKGQPWVAALPILVALWGLPSGGLNDARDRDRE
jgi:hypothetical protein